MDNNFDISMLEDHQRRQNVKVYRSKDKNDFDKMQKKLIALGYWWYCEACFFGTHGLTEYDSEFPAIEIHLWDKSLWKRYALEPTENI